uniref:Uncharacterized protein n=1 Tax=Romanomermis culicivorax TaxID=13658 RepID=A0A915IAN2_ROMCU
MNEKEGCLVALGGCRASTILEMAGLASCVVQISSCIAIAMASTEGSLNGAIGNMGLERKNLKMTKKILGIVLTAEKVC